MLKLIVFALALLGSSAAYAYELEAPAVCYKNEDGERCKAAKDHVRLMKYEFDCRQKYWRFESEIEKRDLIKACVIQQIGHVDDADFLRIWEGEPDVVVEPQGKKRKG